MCILNSPGRTPLDICQLPMKSLVKANFHAPISLSAASTIQESLDLIVTEGSCSDLTVKHSSADKWKSCFCFRIPPKHLLSHCTTPTTQINTVMIADSSQKLLVTFS